MSNGTDMAHPDKGNHALPPADRSEWEAWEQARNAEQRKLIAYRACGCLVLIACSILAGLLAVWVVSWLL